MGAKTTRCRQLYSKSDFHGCTEMLPLVPIIYTFVSCMQTWYHYGEISLKQDKYDAVRFVGSKDGTKIDVSNARFFAEHNLSEKLKTWNINCLYFLDCSHWDLVAPHSKQFKKRLITLPGCSESQTGDNKSLFTIKTRKFVSLAKSSSFQNNDGILGYLWGALISLCECTIHVKAK